MISLDDVLWTAAIVIYLDFISVKLHGWLRRRQCRRRRYHVWALELPFISTAQLVNVEGRTLDDSGLIMTMRSSEELHLHLRCTRCGEPAATEITRGAR